MCRIYSPLLQLIAIASVFLSGYQVRSSPVHVKVQALTLT
jgi:hypothetical protein